MGLPGAGKTTLANALAKKIEAKRLNADEVRKEANDWDFSEEGRKRQAKRMSDFALKLKSEGNNVIADFICPTPEARKLFPADYIVWVDKLSPEDLMIQIKCLLNLKDLIFMLHHKMLRNGQRKF